MFYFVLTVSLGEFVHRADVMRDSLVIGPSRSLSMRSARCLRRDLIYMTPPQFEIKKSRFLERKLDLPWISERLLARFFHRYLKFSRNCVKRIIKPVTNIYIKINLSVVIFKASIRRRKIPGQLRYPLKRLTRVFSIF